MELDEIKKILWRLSVEFVKNNNTMMGEFCYQDLVGDIHMASRRRHIIGDLQLFDAIESNGCTEAVFMFSPNYLNREVDMLYSGMGDIKWKLILPEAIDRDSDDEKFQNLKEIDEEIIEKISASKVEITHFECASNFDINSFKSSVSNI